MSLRLPRATELAHELVSSRLQRGDVAIDATAGNGHDTVFLAQLVGNAGKIYAFDVQPEAIDSTRLHLEEKSLSARVQLVRDSHQNLAQYVSGTRVVMFNLGYLPGSDKTTITQPDTTLAALRASLELLAPAGLITLVIYPGHEGGQDEASAIIEFCHELDPGRFRSALYDSLNFRRKPPFLIAIERC